MSTHSNAIDVLQEDPGILVGNGWHFVAFFQARKSDACVEALQKATKKASIIEGQTKIRNFAYNGVTYYEVWVREKCATDSIHELGVDIRTSSYDA